MAAGFVGRSSEIERVTALLARAASGGGGTLLIGGEPGVGKTTLLRIAIADARRRGFVVCAGEANELEHERPFGPLIQAFDLSPTAVNSDAAAIGARLETTLGDTATIGSGVQRFALADEIVGLIDSRAAGTPLLLTVDDLQWADAATLLALQLASRRAPSLGVAIVCALRAVPRHNDLTALLGALRSHGADELRLDPLGPDEVAELTRLVLGAVPDASVLELVGGAGGNPLFINELLTSVRNENLLSIEDGVARAEAGIIPPTLKLTILQRISFLTERSLELLRCASVLGSSFSASELATIRREPPSELLGSMRDLGEAGLLEESGDRLAFRHDLVREAVYEDLPVSMRRSLHRQVAEALENAGAPRARVAPHFVAGAELGDRRAAAYLHATAQALLSTDPSSALNYARLAIATNPDDASSAEAMRATEVHALAGSGRFAEAADLGAKTAAQIADPVAATRLACFSARCFGAAQRWVEAAELLEECARDRSLPEAEALAMRAEAAYWRAWDNPAATLPAARKLRELARRTGTDASDAVYWSTVALARAISYVESGLRRGGELIHELDPALLRRNIRSGRVDEAFRDVIMYLCMLDRFDEVRSYLALLPSRTEDASHVAPGLIEGIGGIVAFGTGAWDDATSMLDAALAIALESDARTGLGPVLASRCLIGAHRGDLATVQKCVAEAALRPFWEPVECWFRVLLHEVSGDRAGLREALSEALPLMRNHTLGRQLLIDCGRDLVRAYVGIGDLESAQVVAGIMEEIAANADMPWADASALACRGLADGDVDRLRMSVDMARRSPRPLALAECLEWTGKQLSRTKDAGDATAYLLEALDIYTGLGALWDIGRVEQLLRSVGVRTGRRGSRHRPATGWDSLTGRELEVAGLVGEGLSYREIGDRLFLSRRTVETHVEHIFAKLGVRTRAALAQQVRSRR